MDAWSVRFHCILINSFLFFGHQGQRLKAGYRNEDRKSNVITARSIYKKGNHRFITIFSLQEANPGTESNHASEDSAALETGSGTGGGSWGAAVASRAGSAGDASAGNEGGIWDTLGVAGARTGGRAWVRAGVASSSSWSRGSAGRGARRRGRRRRATRATRATEGASLDLGWRTALGNDLSSVLVVGLVVSRGSDIAAC